MIKTNKSLKRILALAVLAVMMISALPTSALAAGFSAAVKSKSMKVYADAYGSRYLGSLSRKTIVTVKQQAGGIAKISYNGRTGYAKVSDLVSVESFAEEAKTVKSARVYQKANGSGASVKVKRGVKVNVLAVKKGVAMVERGGKVGYMDASSLDLFVTTPAQKPETIVPVKPAEPSKPTVDGSDIVDALPDKVVDTLPDKVVEELEKNQYTSDQLEDLKDALEAEYKKQQAQKEEAKKEENKNQETGGDVSIADVFASGKYSNEELCYLFATKVMGYNRAAAAGLLANIKAESGFRVNANGDSGQSYGICQWYSARKTRLLNWCSKNGMDSSTLLAQLYFLKYELETYYPSVQRYMKGVSNDASGAFEAAYYFCYHFEAPANKVSKANSRGSSAQNTYFPKYAA